MTLPRWQPTLQDHLELSAVLLNTKVESLRRLPRIPLAESALHAPFVSFGGGEAYPELVDQAAALIAHLAQNHPLPDGNKRAAFLITARFLDANDLRWLAEDVATDAGMVERIAASAADHAEIVAWISVRTAPAQR
jgi:death-on-curing protein